MEQLLTPYYRVEKEIYITVIQTRLIHDRVQGAKESVDEHAQALRKLFVKAYPTVLCDTPEPNVMGRTAYLLTSLLLACSRNRGKY